MRSTMGNYITDWQRLEKGIVTGCPISVLLFAAAIYRILKAMLIQATAPTQSRVRLTPTTAFMDDMTVTATTEI